MKRLRGCAASTFETLVPRSTTPYRFIDLANEAARERKQTAYRCDELLLRFCHQLERLHVQAQATSSSTTYSRAGERALNVLLALYTDSVQLLTEFGPIVERLKEKSTTPTSRWQIDDGEVLTTMIVELEGRHGAANETLMEAVQTGAFHREVVSPFLSTRISTQLLLQHHMSLWRKGSPKEDPGSSLMTSANRSETVLKALSLESLCTSSAAEGRLLCDAHYAKVPDVNVCELESLEDVKLGAIFVGNPVASGGEDLTVASSPALVRYVVLELIKNALRASVEAPSSDAASVLPPPVQVWLRRESSGNFVDVIVLDGGAGVDSAVAEKALNKFGSTNWDNVSRGAGGESEGGVAAAAAATETAPLWDRLQEQVSYMPARSPLHGIGVGLALSRLHSVYLGGSLHLQSLTSDPTEGPATFGGELLISPEGQRHGTAAILRLPLNAGVFGAREGIPLRVS